MKILCLSDLHLYITDKSATFKDIMRIQMILEETKPHIVCITGDIFESNQQVNPYNFLYNIFENVNHVICVLGNHEFWGYTPKETIDFYKSFPETYNVTYLDVANYVDIDNIRFVGNFFGYDGSLCDIKDQIIEHSADGQWGDIRIKNWFDTKNYITYHNQCKQTIKENISKDKINILLTHSVPHKQLNVHSQYPSIFNAYSGVVDFLKECRVDYAICGHTHRRVVGRIIHGANCINTGSDYGNIQHFLFEI